MVKGVLRFFFDYGAGGCLWAGDSETCARLDVGPVDAAFFGLDGQMPSKPKLVLSETAQQLRDRLDFEHSGYLNPLYPLDPSLWTQGVCDRFNTDVDKLLVLLRQELEADYSIVDEQYRYEEDPRLDEYLTENPSLARIDEVKVSTVGWVRGET
ncbi:MULTISPECIES: hypothetical protein [Rhizobium/Agrobacterium group]|uniref:hypothetical protein n=1 Tax=Rhizobium/Agrobacterium group TaxID=227290 RepID=UPI0022C85505|nr:MULTISPECIES: hypothetical protein [Rhizobium/Agrobacterium group]MCZ7480039.1 hypothetical protein [Rhizobium rhizogenes]MDO3442829.1 hypothetical protein [Agrobacterium sp. V1]